MLLNCIRQKSVTSWRSLQPVDVLSMPFSEEACQRCKQRAQEAKTVESRMAPCPMTIPAGELLMRCERQYPVMPSPPTAAQPPPPPCPFPSTAALPPKPQSPQPVPAQPQAHQAQLVKPHYGGDAMVPLNGWTNEHSQPPRPTRSNRANLLLQQLRTVGPAGENGQEKRRLVERNGTAIMPPNQISVFLEHQGETKRSTLPPNLRTVEQLKSLFLRSFAGLNPTQLQTVAVKVYIQKPNSPHGLFYELEELHDLEDLSVLRLFEQSPPSPAPPPLRPPRPSAIVEPLECLSEPEMMDWNGLAGPREFAQLRPASVLGGGGGRKRRPPPGFDWSGHSSDSSCSAGGHYPKSGSSTPREDREETRRKVDQMERQLASLCSLVHSALLPRHDSGIDVEMAQLRAQILDTGGLDRLNGNSLSDLTNSTLSNGAAYSNGHEEQRNLSQVQAELVGLKSELNGLRRDAQRNALNGHEMIQRALEQVKGTSMAIAERQLLNGSSTLLERLANVQSALRAFEAHLENTRSAVLNSTRRLKLEEVDELTTRLGAIGRETVDLKVEIPVLQRQMETQVRQTMEQLALLCDKLPQVDGCLRRCKTLANLMVTMKKLAIIQDEERPMSSLPSGQQLQQRRTIPVRHISLRNCPSTMTQSNSSHHPLDAILDELNANTKGSQIQQQQQKIGQDEISASFTLRLAATQTKPEGAW